MYRIFGYNDSYDYSEEAAFRQYFHESTGSRYDDEPVGLEQQSNGKYNGYSVGKHWMDVTLTNWLKDIMDGLLFIEELYTDPEFKDFHWWLDSAVKETIKKRLQDGEKINKWWESPDISL